MLIRNVSQLLHLTEIITGNVYGIIELTETAEGNTFAAL